MAAAPQFPPRYERFERPHIVHVRKTVGGMYYADWADYPKYSIGGMLYGHYQTPSTSVAGLHYDWMRPLPRLVGGMYYGRSEA
jgi:hypothetical protein